jgi:CO/xanthine dehydrogenase FAD-binding subunit
MIRSYFRPKTMEEAIELLSKPGARPLGGGTVITQKKDESISVVDLQLLGLCKIRKSGTLLEIGATTTLQSLLEYIHTPQALKTAIKHEAPLNLRNMATVGGSMVVCDGRSPFLTVLLALDPVAFLVPGDEQIHLGDLLPLRPERLKGKLITKINLSLQINSSYEYVARTAMDKPIICVSIGKWSSGRTRMVLGGWGKMPILGYDGKYSFSSEDRSLEIAARNAAHDASDEWASSEYRSAMAALFAKRCINQYCAKKLLYICGGNRVT